MQYETYTNPLSLGKEHKKYPSERSFPVCLSEGQPVMFLFTYFGSSLMVLRRDVIYFILSPRSSDFVR